MNEGEPGELTLIQGSTLRKKVLKPGEHTLDLFGTGATLKTLMSGRAFLITGGSKFSIRKVGV